MMKLRIARKSHQCTERSYHLIQKGEQYLNIVMTPWYDMNPTDRYCVIKACLRCAEEFGLHNSDTRKQLRGDKQVNILQ